MKIKQSELRSIIKEELAAVRAGLLKEAQFRRRGNEVPPGAELPEDLHSEDLPVDITVMESMMNYDTWKSTEPDQDECPTCSNTGDMDCPACMGAHGDLDGTCDVCDGSGMVECEECGVFLREPAYAREEDEDRWR